MSMKYIGIDLGTTNSAICSYDGESVRLYKSPDQHDVTPSAIFIDRRGNKYLGRRAYDSAARNPHSAATKFKRMMGTSTPVRLPAVDVSMTPEECSAEILKLCFGYLPEDIRNNPDLGTVITVPAAFNQMQKDATLAAAEMAGIGRVALMQEPVAAVMSAMRKRKGDGIFLIFDLGGGTLDIAIAESISGRVSLLAHGGIAMCGGADFDRAILDNVVKPWLISNFDLPDDLSVNKKYTSLLRMSLWASEKAKIELSTNEDSVISLTEADLNASDESGDEMYVDIPFDRPRFNELMTEKLDEAIQAARETLEKAGLSAHDVERIVFVGGPTHYKPLRDRVVFELGIPEAVSSEDINPMSAVAEGAAVFAESIDWDSQNRGRKSGRSALDTGGILNLTFNYIARTPDTTARVVARLKEDAESDGEFEINSLDTGWTSGRMLLKDGAEIDLHLNKRGDNTFKVFVYDARGGSVSLADDKIIIARTAASIDAIPASHSISLATKDKIGGPTILHKLVKEGEHLPKKGRVTLKAEESLRLGGSKPFNFQLWEGEIANPITDNRFIGLFQITGKDFDEGVIAAGADLIFDYEVLDSGNIVVDVSVPSIGSSFNSGRNFYSRDEGGVDYTNASKRIEEDAEHTLKRVDEMASKVDDPRLNRARNRLEKAELVTANESDPDITKQAMDDIQEAKKLLALARQANLKDIRQLELEKVVELFDQVIREHASPTDVQAFENLVKTAERSIPNQSGDFESHLDELRTRCFVILWRQDWFVIHQFKWLAQNSHLYPDEREHEQLVRAGVELLEANDINRLRQVVRELNSLRIGSVDGADMMANVNIILG